VEVEGGDAKMSGQWGFNRGGDGMENEQKVKSLRQRGQLGVVKMKREGNVRLRTPSMPTRWVKRTLKDLDWKKIQN